MSLELNAEEIIEVASQIERNGAAFYSRAASLVNDEKAKKLLEDLAALEQEHELYFESLRADPALLSEILGDPDGETCTYLKALADGVVFSGAGAPAERLKGEVDVANVIKTAIELEVASIAFYQGIRELITAETKVGKLDAIIAEERRHVIILSEALTSISK
jgi:rubrerythrin